MKCSIVALAAVSLMSLEVMARDTISANITVLNSSKHAESANNSIHSYLVKTSSSTTYTRMTGTGNFASVNQNTNSTKSSTVGVDVQGYSQIILEDIGNGRIKVSTDSNLTASDDKVGVTIVSQIESEAVITKGSWQEYTEGGEIEYQLTEESLEKEARISGKNFSNSIETALKNGLAAQGLSSISMDSDVTVKPRDESQHSCKATLSSLDCFIAKQEIEINIRVSGL